MINTPIDIGAIRDRYSYDETTGVFINKKRNGSSAPEGAIAGNKDHRGYWKIKVNGKNFMAHRLAWAYFYGTQPPEMLDHIDGDRSNNAIENLRPADYSLNLENQRKPRTNNKSGYLGVRLNKSGYTATIVVKGEQKHLGTYETPEEASAVYIAAKRTEHMGCTI